MWVVDSWTKSGMDYGMNVVLKVFNSLEDALAYSIVPEGSKFAFSVASQHHFGTQEIVYDISLEDSLPATQSFVSGFSFASFTHGLES